ncbi:hypothetical protein NQ317_012044, partial [Molorchus minor]
FDFITEHRAGTAHRNADALSRRPCPEDCKHCHKVEAKEAAVRRTTVLDDNWQIEKIKIDQENDAELKHIMTWKKEGRRPIWAEIARYSPVLKSYWAQWNSLDLNDGCLKRVLENGEGKEDRRQIVVPKTRVPGVLREIHGGASGGHLGRRRGLSPKLQTLWEGPYEVLARINDVVYRIKKSSGGKPRVVHFNRLTPFSGSNDASVRTVVPSTHEMSFENFMAQYSPNHKARYGVTREEQRDLFQVSAEFALAHCVAQDLQMSRGIAAAFKEKFGNVDELRRQRPEVGDVLQLGGDETSRRVFYLVTKHLSRDKPTYENVWGITNQPERCFIVSRGHPFGDTQVILWTGWPELAGGPEYVRSPVPVHRDRGS